MVKTKSDDLPGIGARLRQAREDAGLTQGQVAELLQLPRPAISEMENETRRISAGELKQLAQHYHVSIEWLTGEPVSKRQKIKIAARKLSELQDKDLGTVMRIVDSFAKGRRPDKE